MLDSNTITFGICTFNRKDILIKSARSLSLVKGIENVHIRIFDDCSTEYDEAFLHELFPEACSIVRQKKNLGADKNTSVMYEEFLKSGDEWLFNADSDLIYRSDILDAIQRFSEPCGGFMTLFNCISHKTVSGTELFDIKDSVGAAGCLLGRDVVRLILDRIKYRSVSFDVGFSSLLPENGFSLYASKESYVQHIGVTGFNSSNLVFDYGKGFRCDSLVNAGIIEDTFEQYVEHVNLFKEKTSWKLFNSVVTIPRKADRYCRTIREMMEKK